MPKWTTNGRRVFDNSTSWCADCATEVDADRIAERQRADIDALEAEIAELRGYRNRWEASETTINEAIRLRDRAYGDRDHWRALFAAANATLDKLLEVVPEGIRTYGGGEALLVLESVYHILYPTPETPDDIVRWPSGAPFTAEDAHHGLTGE